MKLSHCFLFLFLIWTLPTGLLAQESPTDGSGVTTLILVRHTEKMEDGTKDPSLSIEGEKRAIKLASYLLKHYDISGIYSTPYQRTQLTVAPLADSLELPVLNYDWGKADSFLQMLLKEKKGKDLLIVGHSNTTPILVNKLLGEEKYEWLQEDEYDSIFILKVKGTHILEEQKTRF